MKGGEGEEKQRKEKSKEKQRKKKKHPQNKIAFPRCRSIPQPRPIRTPVRELLFPGRTPQQNCQGGQDAPGRLAHLWMLRCLAELPSFTSDTHSLKDRTSPGSEWHGHADVAQVFLSTQTSPPSWTLTSSCVHNLHFDWRLAGIWHQYRDAGWMSLLFSTCFPALVRKIKNDHGKLQIPTINKTPRIWSPPGGGVLVLFVFECYFIVVRILHKRSGLFLNCEMSRIVDCGYNVVQQSSRAVSSCLTGSTPVDW